MDQNSTNGTGKGSWRDKLGLGDKGLPKISDQFKTELTPDPKPAIRAAAAEVKPAPAKSQPVARPAPMAPRPGAAKSAPPPSAIKVGAPAAQLGEGFVDRLRSQREAAERLAEQRVAAARQKIEPAAPPPVKNGNGAGKPAPAERPKFSFADEEAEDAKPAAAPPKPVDAAPAAKVEEAPPAPPPAAKLPPVIKADAQPPARPQSNPQLIRPTAPPPALGQAKPLVQPPLLKPGLKAPGVFPPMPPRPAGAGTTSPIMPPRPQLGSALQQPAFKSQGSGAPAPFELRPRAPVPPASYPPQAGQGGFRPIDPPGFQRPQPPVARGYAQQQGGYADPGALAARRDAYESYRRQPLPPGAVPDEPQPEEPEDEFVAEPQLPPPRRSHRPLAAPARNRRQSSYEDDLGEVFDDESPALPTPRRRASAQDYSRAYREYEEGGHGEERTRSIWPWILMVALLIATAIALAGGWYYMNFIRAPQTTGVTGDPVPVIEKSKEDPKTRTVKNTEDAQTGDNSEAAATAQPQPEAARKKQIYLRILGDRSVDETAIVPTEEPPVAPPAEGAGGTDAGASAEPVPVPADPPPPAVEGSGGQPDVDGGTGQTSDPAATPEPLPVPPAPGSGDQQGGLPQEEGAKSAEIAPAGGPKLTDDAAALAVPGDAGATGVPALKAEAQALTLGSEQKTRSFGPLAAVESPEIKPASDGAAETIVPPPTTAGGVPEADIDTKDVAALDPPAATADAEPKAEVIELAPPATSGEAKDAAPLAAPEPADDAGGAGAIKDTALEAPVVGDVKAKNSSGDAAFEDIKAPPPVAEEQPVKKPVAKKPKPKTALKKAKTKALAEARARAKSKKKPAATDVATTESVTAEQPQETVQAGPPEEATVGSDGPLQLAETGDAAVTEEKSGNFFDIFKRKPRDKVTAEKRVAKLEPPPPVKKKVAAVNDQPADSPEPAASGGFGVQLGSFRTEAEARAEINRLKAKHGGKIAGMSARISRSELAGSTRFRAGFTGAESREAAGGVCGALLAAGERDCVVRRN